VSRTSPQDADPPRLDGYHHVGLIGTGGNARVYLYEQEFPSRGVAVKVLNESALSADARRRFIAEVNVTAGLAHPHIVQVYEAKVTSDGRPYIVMLFCPEPNLAVRASRERFSVGEVLRIGIQIGGAVEASHRRNVLHRDIKPQNILTDPYGSPVLADFGIATTRPGDGPEMLSVPWSPPELLGGTGPGDQRSDVYSLGATLWHLLVGRPPFEQPGGGNTSREMADRICSDPPPGTKREDVPNSLERLLRHTMAKDPAARPQSAMELIRGLQSIEQELDLNVTQPTLRADEPTRRGTRGDTVARPLDRGQPAGPTVPAENAHSATQPNEPVSDLTLNHSRPHQPHQLQPPAPPAVPPPEPAPTARARIPVVLDPSGGVAAAKRGANAVPGTGTRLGRGRVLAFAVGGALLVIVAVVAVFAVPHARGGESGVSPPTQSGSQSAYGVGGPAPGAPVVTQSRANAMQVEFRWTYANPASGDTFRLQLSGVPGEPFALVSKPAFLLTVAKGHRACLTVLVRRPDGDTSPASNTSCWTN
jgi:eukaryotic-like serine/threonine-protein kinase